MLEEERHKIKCMIFGDADADPPDIEKKFGSGQKRKKRFGASMEKRENRLRRRPLIRVELEKKHLHSPLLHVGQGVWKMGEKGARAF